MIGWALLEWHYAERCRYFTALYCVAIEETGILCASSFVVVRKRWSRKREGEKRRGWRKEKQVEAHPQPKVEYCKWYNEHSYRNNHCVCYLDFILFLGSTLYIIWRALHDLRHNICSCNTSFGTNGLCTSRFGEWDPFSLRHCNRILLVPSFENVPIQYQSLVL